MIVYAFLRNWPDTDSLLRQFVPLRSSSRDSTHPVLVIGQYARRRNRTAHTNPCKDSNFMKQQFISNNNEPNLLLIFSGWGTHAELFSPYSIRQTDICVCYDYREDTFDCTPFLRYKQISVIGWSFGVWIGSIYTFKNTVKEHTKTLPLTEPCVLSTIHTVSPKPYLPQHSTL